MSAYFVRRLLALIPTLLFASIIVFTIVRLVPGDVVDLMLSQNDISADALTREQLVHALGLDRPIWDQYLRWVTNIVLHGDLGQSLWQSEPVLKMVMARIPATFSLGVLALFVALTVALPIGIVSATRQDSAVDYVARSFSILMLAVPSFWLGTMVIVFPSVWWGWSPTCATSPFSKTRCST
jgi:peptide/nickel transport system permease protein